MSEKQDAKTHLLLQVQICFRLRENNCIAYTHSVTWVLSFLDTMDTSKSYALHLKSYETIKIETAQ